MASSKDYLQFVLEQLSELQEITSRSERQISSVCISCMRGRDCLEKTLSI